MLTPYYITTILKSYSAHHSESVRLFHASLARATALRSGRMQASASWLDDVDGASATHAAAAHCTAFDHGGESDDSNAAFMPVWLPLHLFSAA